MRVLRDPTRGGVATTLNEFIEGSDLGIVIEEDKIPVRPQVKAACGMLGLEPLYCANEGKLLAVVDSADASMLLAAMRETEEGRDAALIGHVSADYPGRLVMQTEFGGKRILQKLTGAQLPEPSFREYAKINCEQRSQLRTRAHRPRLAGDASVGRREASQSSAQSVFEAAELPQKQF